MSQPTRKPEAPETCSGTAPFHFIPTAGLVGFGPYPVAAGITVDALALDFTGGTVGCISRVARLTVQ